MTDRAAVDAALAEAHRRHWALVVAATLRTVGYLDLAEECVQEAYAAALRTWPRDGVPAKPAAWLTTTAGRRALDLLRRERTLRRKLPLLIEPETVEAADEPPAPVEDPAGAVRDERLRLIFLCCHPALAEDARTALTLRLVCGMSAADIARAFLVPEATMAARITRAKRKIAGSGIAFRLPGPDELPDRLGGVLAVIHLLFTIGHTAPSGDALLRTEVLDSAVRSARMLHELMPDEPEVRGLLALLLATDARRATRTAADGRLLRLEEQDRSRWDRSAIAEAGRLVADLPARGPAQRYRLQAAIAVVYAAAPSYDRTDWGRALELYDRLLEVWPSPVVALNRTVPLAQVAGPAAALAQVQALAASGRLADYGYLPAVEADLLVRLGRPAAAAEAYRRALALTHNTAERDFLAGRLAALGSGGPHAVGPVP